MQDLNLKDRILKYMQSHRGGLTVKECQELFGTYELRKIISDLKYGYVISDEWETGQNRYGDNTRWKRYYLLGKKKESLL